MLNIGIHTPLVVVHKTIEDVAKWTKSVISERLPEEIAVAVLGTKPHIIIPNEPFWYRITTLDGRMRYFRDGVEVLIENIPKELIE